jgi:hypothetical protein
MPVAVTYGLGITQRCNTCRWVIRAGGLNHDL